MQLIGNGTKFRLNLGGGERLDGRSEILCRLSANPAKLGTLVVKAGKLTKSVAVSRR